MKFQMATTGIRSYRMLSKRRKSILWLHLVRIFCNEEQIIGRRPQFRLLAKNIHKTVRTDTDRARYDWL